MPAHGVFVLLEPFLPSMLLNSTDAPSAIETLKSPVSLPVNMSPSCAV